MKQLKIILAAVAAFLLLIIILQNTDSVETRILSAKVTMPLAILLAVCMLLGYLLGILTCMYLEHRRKQKQRAAAAAALSS